MTTPELAARTNVAGVVAVWLVAALAAVAIGVFVPLDQQVPWGTVALGGCLVLAFAIQLAVGRSKGYIDRVAASVAGALLAMGAVSAVFALAAVIPG